MTGRGGRRAVNQVESSVGNAIESSRHRNHSCYLSFCQRTLGVIVSRMNCSLQRGCFFRRACLTCAEPPLLLSLGTIYGHLGENKIIRLLDFHLGITAIGVRNVRPGGEGLMKRRCITGNAEAKRLKAPKAPSVPLLAALIFSQSNSYLTFIKV